MREYHVRFCERLKVKFLRSTHLFPFISWSATLPIFNAAPDDRLDFICEAIISGHVHVAAPEVSTPILQLE